MRIELEGGGAALESEVERLLQRLNEQRRANVVQSALRPLLCVVRERIFIGDHWQVSLDEQMPDIVVTVVADINGQFHLAHQKASR